MLAFLPRFAFNDKLKPVFNPKDFNYTSQYVVFSDLLQYADKDAFNNFTSFNVFRYIQFTNNLNDVSPLTFSYIKNLKLDAQNQLDKLDEKTTGLSFNNNISIFSNMVSIPVLKLNNRDLETRLIEHENDISKMKTKTMYMNSIDGITSFTNPVEVSSLELNGSDLNTRLVNIETDVTETKQSINDLETEVINNNIRIDNLFNNVVKLNTDQTIEGKKTFIEVPYINNKAIATTDQITSAINALINGAPSTLDTLNEIATRLAQDQNSINSILSSMVNITSAQNISGVKTFLNGIIVQGISTFATVTGNILSFTRISSNDVITNNINVNNVNSNNVSTNTVICNNIKTFEPYPFPYAYIIDGNIQYPILITKLESFENLGITNISHLSFTLLPYTKLTVLDVNKCQLVYIHNDMNEMIYNETFEFLIEPKYFILERTKI